MKGFFHGLFSCDNQICCRRNCDVIASFQKRVYRFRCLRCTSTPKMHLALELGTCRRTGKDGKGCYLNVTTPPIYIYIGKLVRPGNDEAHVIYNILETLFYFSGLIYLYIYVYINKI